MNSVALRDVSVRFGDVQVLTEVSLELEKGAVTMMVGPNGAGKSTLSRVLLGLVRAEPGRIELDGKPCRIDNHFKQNLGYLPEAVAFSDNLRGREVLRFFARARGVPLKQVDAALERVGLGFAARRKVRHYSKGMRQRLGLAVATLGEPSLLVLDEPTGGLDGEGLYVLWSVLDEWREQGRIVLLTSHHLDVLERRVDRINVLKDGKMVAVGSPEELRKQALLQHRVTFDLSPEEPAAVDAFAAALGAWEPCVSEREDHRLVASIAGNDLLPLMDLRAEHPRAVVGLRIEEPTLEMVYRHLLEEAP